MNAERSTRAGRPPWVAGVTSWFSASCFACETRYAVPSGAARPCPACDLAIGAGERLQTVKTLRDRGAGRDEISELTGLSRSTISQDIRQLDLLEHACSRCGRRPVEPGLLPGTALCWRCEESTRERVPE